MADLKNRESELSVEVGPIEDELDAIKERRERNALVFRDGQISLERYKTELKELDKSERLMRDRQARMSKDHLADLIKTREQLQGAKDWKAIAEKRLRLGMPMRVFSMLPEFAESDEIIELRGSELLPLKMPSAYQIPSLLRRWLDRLHAYVTAYPDRIEIRGRITADVLLAPKSRQTAPAPR